MKIDPTERVNSLLALGFDEHGRQVRRRVHIAERLVGSSLQLILLLLLPLVAAAMWWRLDRGFGALGVAAVWLWMLVDEIRYRIKKRRTKKRKRNR